MPARYRDSSGFGQYNRWLLLSYLFVSGGSMPEAVSEPPMICPSKAPMPVFIGRTVLTVPCRKPGALLLITNEFQTPGPHQIFSVEIPIETAPLVYRMLDWPG